MRAGYIKCSLGGLFGSIHLFIYLQVKRKKAIHKIQEEAKKVYKNSTIKTSTSQMPQLTSLTSFFAPKMPLNVLLSLLLSFSSTFAPASFAGTPGALPCRCVTGLLCVMAALFLSPDDVQQDPPRRTLALFLVPGTSSAGLAVKKSVGRM